MIPETVLPGVEVYTQLLRFFLVMGAGAVFTRAVIMPLATRAASRKDKRAKHSIENLAGITSLFAVFTVALQAAQFGNLVTVIGAIAAALTVAVGFGMRDQISNLVAGILIQLDNPFVKGDYIEVSDTFGRVKDIRLRATTLNGSNGEKLVVPNSALTTNPVRNYTKGNRNMTSIELSFDTKKAGEKAEKALKAAKDHEKTLENPEPQILYRGFEEDKVLQELRYWTQDSADIPQIKSEVLEKINEIK